jgi:hypothetical protein
VTPLSQRVDLRIFPDMKTGISEIRFRHNRKLAGAASARNEDLNIQNFLKKDRPVKTFK